MLRIKFTHEIINARELFLIMVILYINSVFWSYAFIRFNIVNIRDYRIAPKLCGFSQLKKKKQVNLQIVRYFRIIGR